MSNDALSEPRPRRKGPAISIVVALILLTTFWAATLTQPGTLRSDGSPRLEARFRRLFETNAPGIRVLAVPMNGLLYLFGERRGADTVFVASSSTRGRLLIFTPEIEFERGDPEREPLFVRNVSAIHERIATLLGAGVERILLVPVPTKLSVELAIDPSLRSQARGIPVQPSAFGSPTSRAAELPGESSDGHRAAEVYERFANSLDGASVSVVPLQRLFTSRAASREDPVFSYEDTHWTSLGLNLAAAEVVRAWRGVEPTLVKGGSRRPRRTPPGDLQALLALPDRSWFRTHPFEEEVYELHRRPTKETCPRRAFLLGTSYSSHRGQKFAEQLMQGGGCPVTDFSVSGEGAVASFRALLSESRESLQGAIVIWEFPFRDLLDERSFVLR